MTGGNLISFSKKTKNFTYPVILMTDVVYKNYKRENPKGKDILNNYWVEQKYNQECN